MTVRSTAIEAIDAYRAGTYETLAEACTALGARVEIVNVLFQNELYFPESAFVSDAVQAARESTCRGCVQFKEPNTCTLCECPIVFFTSQEKNVCPIGLWT
jgi:hypothetical protein